MKRSYLDYAMSVIVARALPDARDGLKPVHRRILHAMQEAGYTAERPYRKSARIVGDVMGRYHPHGDQAIYDAMVRLAQSFAMRLPLLDGQGNFGSMDGDPPAAMRYTEIRLGRPAEALLTDIAEGTVDFQPNYDGTAEEPVVLPAEFPNLLVNGAGGIAVGMATNIPTHNLGEVIDACCALLANPELGIDELMRFLPGPDFPTGAIILGRVGIRSAYHLGRGSLVVRGRAAVESLRKDREAIVITEIPYQVNKASMVEKIAEQVRAKRIEGISDIRDESDRHGLRVVVELKRDAIAEVVLNQIYRYSALQTSFGVNLLALNRGRPETLNLKGLLSAFLEFREEVVVRRTRHRLTKARERAHVLAGLAVAVANLDAVIALIRGAPDPAAARAELMARAWPAAEVAAIVELIDEPGHRVIGGIYRLSETQARAILELRLQRLTGLGREEIAAELAELARQITDYLELLDSRLRLLALVREELLTIRERFATPRLTEIQEQEFEADDEALIPREDMVVTVTHAGYIKRVPVSTYRTQGRGGQGRTAMATREDDFVRQLFVLDSHTPVLFFSSLGRVYKLKVHRLPAGAPQARGRPMVNLLPLQDGETIQTLLPLPQDESRWAELNVMFATASGKVRRNALDDFVNVPSNGKIAMKLDEPGDAIVGVQLCTETDDVLLAAGGGKCVRFPVIDVRVFKGRSSDGVRGMLARRDRVVSMAILRHSDLSIEEREAYLRWSAWQRRSSGEEAAGEESRPPPRPERADALAAAEEFLLTVTDNGLGKRSSAYEYRVTNRGGQGIINIDTAARNSRVVAALPVAETDQIMLVSSSGRLIRLPVRDIGIRSRNTVGVVLQRADAERVVSVARLSESLEEPGTAPADGGGSGDVEATTG
ncbi:MAG: DNA gyrase subunit A [Alphaproteobacteria bacterium]|nr:DNA gyrase subunit A [Alphaproteobacteria bacterium]